MSAYDFSKVTTWYMFFSKTLKTIATTISNRLDISLVLLHVNSSNDPINTKKEEFVEHSIAASIDTSTFSFFPLTM